jgi:hypothetical protein
MFANHKNLVNFFNFPCVFYNIPYYATSREVAGSRLDEVNDFFSIYLILPAALGPGFYSASNRNEYQKQKNVSGEYSATGV